MAEVQESAILALVKQVEELNTAVSDLSEKGLRLTMVVEALAKRVIDDAESFEFRVQNLIKGIK